MPKLLQSLLFPLLIIANSACEKNSNTDSSDKIPNRKNEDQKPIKVVGSQTSYDGEKLLKPETLLDYEAIKKRILLNSDPLTDDEKLELSNFFKQGPIEDCKKLLAEMPVDDTYNFFLMQFSRRFAENDIVGAVAWLKSLPEEANLQSAYSVIGSEAAKNPELAEKFIKNIIDPGLKRQFSTSYIGNLVNVVNGHSKLREIVNSESRHSDLGLDTPSLVMALGSIRNSPENTLVVLESMRTLLENYSDLSMFSKTSIADMVDPYSSQMTDFIKNNSEAKGVTELLTGPVIASWAEKDPNAASLWLESQTGKSRDFGIIGLVSTIAKLQPVSAMQWAISASDPEIRKRAVGTVLSNSYSETEQKKAIIINSILSQEEKDSYLKFISQ